MSSDPRPLSDIAPGSLKERILAKARAESEALARELEDPAYRAERQRERERKREAARREHERCVAEGARLHWLSQGIGEREADVLQAGLDADRYPVVRVVRGFWEQSVKTILLLCGGSGTGKSVAACEPITQCRFQYQHPDFGPTWAVSSRPRDRGHYALAGDLAVGEKFGPKAEKLLATLLAVRYLVIDELGQEVMTQPWMSLFERIVSERHRAKKKLVLVSNLDVDAFRKHYGESGESEGRIMRRIRTDGKVFGTGSRDLFNS